MTDTELNNSLIFIEFEEKPMKTQNTFRNRMLVPILVYFIISILSTTGIALAQWYQTSAFSDGEYLKYKVKWGIIRLGTIEIFQEKSIFDDIHVFKVKMRAKSANLPFINVFFINEGNLNPYEPVLQHFTLISGKGENNITTYIYDPQSHTIRMKTIEDEQTIRSDSLIYSGDLYDALGIFMMIRCLSASGFNITLHNIVEFKISQTHLNFSGEQEAIKVAAFDDPKKALKFSGKADWVGKSWAGVSGPFKGWISQDPSAIPLKVQIKIFLGSITLELENFHRESGMENSGSSSLANK